MQKDKIDDVQAQWKAVSPKLDTAPVAILGRIYRIAAIAGRAITKTFEDHNLERGEFDVIGTLFRAGPPHELTPTALYTQFMITSGGLTHRLNLLEKRGLIARHKSPDDGRSFRIRLTKSGRDLALEAYKADLDVERQLLEGLTHADRATLTDLLRKLHLLVEGNAR